MTNATKSSAVEIFDWEINLLPSILTKLGYIFRFFWFGFFCGCDTFSGCSVHLSRKAAWSCTHFFVAFMDALAFAAASAFSFLSNAESSDMSIWEWNTNEKKEQIY